jgi:hypothetical protein
VISLRYSRAADAEKLLQQVLSPRTARGSIPLNIGVDERKNAIVVVAPKPKGAEIRAILERIDTPGPGLLTGTQPTTLEPHLKTFHLRSIEPDKALEDALHLVFGSGGNFVLDRQRKLVVATADASTLTAAEALLANLEAKSVQPANDVQLRLVWLVNGLPRENAPSVPDDLKEVLPGLAKMGIDKPRLAAQTLVSFMPDSTFEASGVAQLDTVCQFSVRGFYNDKKDGSALQITVTGSTMRGNTSVNICKLETSITAPPGHLVVLGMTPTDTMTSVFVVQVLRPDVKKPATPK